MNTFTQLPLIEPLQRALHSEGYTTPTPIQAQSIPYLLDGKDLLGVAQTGTGKTAAFTLPMLQYLTAHKKMPSRGAPRALVLAPTRELAAQIGDSFAAYGKFLRITHTVIFGGVGQNPQVQAVSRGVDVVIATPGRLLDLMNQGHIRLDGIEIFVLDEADRMLDMGFIHDIKKIIAKLPQKRQSLFFSATMSEEIEKLARSMLTNPAHVSVTPQATTVEKIEQKLMFVDKDKKDQLLKEILADPSVKRAIVFTQMKHIANKVAQHLTKAGIRADAIHGNKSQGARTQAMENFRSGRSRVLVATDIAARGIDVEGITHVVNYELPNEPETYVHRIGRTARAGAEGIAISFCAAFERDYLRDIEKLIRMQIPVVDNPYHSEAAKHATGAAARPPPKVQRSRGHRSSAPARHPTRHAPHGAQRSHSSVKGHGRRPMRRY